MAPLAYANPGAMAFLNRLLSAISSFFKSKFRSKKKKGWGDYSNPILVPPSEWPAGFEFLPREPDTVDRGTQTRTPSPPRNPSPELPAGFELKPAGPERVPWLEKPDLQNTDEYDELMANQWNNMRKRSVEAQEPVVIAMNRAGIHSQVQQQLQGESQLSYSQGLPHILFIILIIASIGAAAVLAMVKIRRKVRLVTIRQRKLEKSSI